MYYEYYDITHKGTKKRFIDFGAAQAYARQLGKDLIPYRWELIGCFHDNRPNANPKRSSWHIKFLNGIYGHPVANEYLEFYNGEGY